LNSFKVESVDSRRRGELEQLGARFKFWYRTNDNQRVLFKAEERGTGEDWAEKVCSELAACLGLPHVEYELAQDLAFEPPTRGVVCKTCAPWPWSLVLGNQLLLAHDPDYPTDKNKYKVCQHTVSAVQTVLAKLALPPAIWCTNLPIGIESAADVFTGYVMFDAWVANQDRHHQNWGALRKDDVQCLAPSFDHGASLARNLSDFERERRLQSTDHGYTVAAFTNRARSAFYTDIYAARPLETHAAWKNFAIDTPKAASIWADKLSNIEPAQIQSVLNRVPASRMSPTSREFTAQLLSLNRNQILEGAQS